MTFTKEQEEAIREIAEKRGGSLLTVFDRLVYVNRFNDDHTIYDLGTIELLFGEKAREKVGRDLRS